VTSDKPLFWSRNLPFNLAQGNELIEQLLVTRN
jgi:hypothetical protein